LGGVNAGVRKIGAPLSKDGRADAGWMGFIHAMEVFAVTVFVSLLFGILFAVLFVAERAQRPVRSLEQEALLPLDDTGIIRAGSMNGSAPAGATLTPSSKA